MEVERSWSSGADAMKMALEALTVLDLNSKCTPVGTVSRRWQPACPRLQRDVVVAGVATHEFLWSAHCLVPPSIHEPNFCHSHIRTHKPFRTGAQQHLR
eukprot:COSAG04_NODE_3550_length_2717_cov_1.629870_2_plen_99_part_00